MSTRPHLVTVAGKSYIERDYVRSCIDSWKNITVVNDVPFYVMNDGLTSEQKKLVEASGGLLVEEESEAISEALANRPGLRFMRRALVTWRHVVDTTILFQNVPYILLIDTDVFVVEPIQFADQDLDFVFNGDSTPGYRGKWYLPLTETALVPTVNPGFLLFRPAAVDLDILEKLVQRYFLNCKNYWWTRQAALAILIGRSGKRGIFSGRDVRVFSGDKKRTPEQIQRNYWMYYGSNAPADADFARRCLEGAAVVHCAGRGKKWVDLLRAWQRREGTPRLIEGLPTRNAHLHERFLIAVRMFVIQHLQNR